MTEKIVFFEKEDDRYYSLKIDLHDGKSDFEVVLKDDEKVFDKLLAVATEEHLTVIVEKNFELVNTIGTTSINMHIFNIKKVEIHKEKMGISMVYIYLD